MANSRCELEVDFACSIQSGYEIGGPFSKPKCSVSQMKQYFVCIAALFLASAERQQVLGQMASHRWKHTLEK